MVNVDAAAHCGGVGKHIGGVAELELFAQPGRDFVAVDRDVSGGQVDHRFQADAAAGRRAGWRADRSSTGPTSSTRAMPRAGALRASSADMHIDHRRAAAPASGSNGGGVTLKRPGERPPRPGHLLGVIALSAARLPAGLDPAG